MILNTIAEKTAQRVAQAKARLPLEQIRAKAEALPVSEGFPLEQAIRKDGLSFLCEIKKASPSKGLIAPQFPYLSIAKEYEQAGADAISCLTEPYYFLGRDDYLSEIKDVVSIPVLRKDFIIDPYQIYESRWLRADAILLICALLSTEQLREYSAIAHSLGLSCLVEAHDEREVESALKAGARMIGVNNRNLHTFEVDVQTSVRLRHLIPPEILFVSESGVQSPENIQVLRENGTDAVLIGETLMRSQNKREQLARLRGDAG